ncbi:MAG: hypothetical protein ACI88L_000266 [Candidatus Paceibacteria bacterium]|jgi:uncharacterized protein (TIGR00725 family)
MKNTHTICIAGAADITHLGLDVIDSARAFGKILASSGSIINTAASGGFSFWCAKGVQEKSGTVIGFSPASNKEEHLNLYRLPVDPFSSVVYTGFGFPGRNLMMMRSSDALILGPGYIETFHEFIMALEEGKVIGVLEGPWEIDDAIHDLIGKKSKTMNVIFDKDPEKLLKRVMSILDVNKSKQ